ncbi:hypothetical protein MVEN_00060200 [Mycena venus]|uniref:Uncharacterized protein n=1 Tax=Mycena venus TaxID=2733690 RepID=A0A8H6ZA81_9AGAR|nr:hypothetical protein MVEN_00060200 [Mycena venus]
MAHWTSFVTAIQEACTVALSDVNDDLNPAVAKIMYLSSWPSALLATHEGLCVHSPDPLLEALLFKNYAWEKKCVIHSDTQRGPTNGYYNFNLETEEAKNLTLRDFMEYVCFVMQELEEEPDGLQYPQWKNHPPPVSHPVITFAKIVIFPVVGLLGLICMSGRTSNSQ